MASVTETEEKILNGLNLSIGKGETHAIMGPNGGGKSTLVNVIAGKDSYTVDSGEIKYLEEDLIDVKKVILNYLNLKNLLKNLMLLKYLLINLKN